MYGNVEKCDAVSKMQKWKNILGIFSNKTKGLKLHRTGWHCGQVDIVDRLTLWTGWYCGHIDIMNRFILQIDRFSWHWAPSSDIELYQLTLSSISWLWAPSADTELHQLRLSFISWLWAPWVKVLKKGKKGKTSGGSF